MPALLHPCVRPNGLSTCHHGWLHSWLVRGVVACRCITWDMTEHMRQHFVSGSEIECSCCGHAGRHIHIHQTLLTTALNHRAHQTLHKVYSA
jgi:hypothetical protein